MKAKKIKQESLKRIEKLVNEELYNPYKVPFKITFEDGRIYLNNGAFEIHFELNNDEWNNYDFTLLTSEGSAIGFYDIDQIIGIRNSMEDIIDIIEWEEE